MEEREAGLTLIDCLERWRDEYGAAVAVRDKTTSLTYAELFDESSRFASGLASEGVEAGDKIVLQLPNKAESLVVLFGSVMRGCIPVLALPTHRETEILHFCSKSRASCLIVPSSSSVYDFESLASSVRKTNPRIKCFVVGKSTRNKSVSELRGEPLKITRPDQNSTLFLLPSGGTTGLPKLIPRSNFSYVYNFSKAAS